jgi:beta-lactamase superfamily II metal-dependent hydrolase
MKTHFIAIDLVKVYRTTEKKKSNLRTVLAWGDEVEVVEIKTSHIEIAFQDFVEKPDGSILQVSTKGFILKPGSGGPALSSIIKPIAEKKVLQVSFVDVQQGDGCVIETPKGKVLLLDGGENQMFARYLAARYSGSSPDNPKVIDCIIVSHGDADHFEGLPKILESETNKNLKKRLFINPQRVYHNGIIKRPGKKPDGSKRKDTELLGNTTKVDSQLYLTDLEEDLLQVDDSKLNAPFRKWKKTLKKYSDSFDSPIVFKRLDNTSTNDFNFLNSENIKVQVLGPIVEEINNKSALKFLRQPPRSVVVTEDEDATPSGAYSASHTINGHSVILRMQYGNVSFMFAGDLNEEAEDILVANADALHIQSEILKVPHHGSADFSNDFFEAVKPLVSVVSSGDESEMKEYIHPRATLMGALGKHSRINRPLIFVTELVAFFKMEGWASVTKKPPAGKKNPEFFAFSRTAYGVVHVRTDGKKILVFTHSGQKGLKEAYSFLIENEGDEPVRQDVVMA